jgi:hypothetical protein
MPGPKASYTKELLLKAGVQATHRDRREGDLGGLLGIQLNDVLETAGVLLHGNQPTGKKPSPPVFYKIWKSYDSYLADLVSVIFDAEGFDLRHLDSGRTLEDAIAHHALADHAQMSRHDAALFFSLFALADIDVVGDPLRSVYDNYDARVVPALERALERYGRRPRSPLDVADVAVALTALTEGLMLRSLVQSERSARAQLWSRSAIALVMGMTESIANKAPADASGSGWRRPKPEGSRPPPPGRSSPTR